MSEDLKEMTLIKFQDNSDFPLDDKAITLATKKLGLKLNTSPNIISLYLT